MYLSILPVNVGKISRWLLGLWGWVGGRGGGGAEGAVEEALPLSTSNLAAYSFSEEKLTT